MPGYKGSKAKKLPGSVRRAKKIGTSLTLYKKVNSGIVNIKRKVLAYDVYITASQAIALNFALGNLPAPTDFTNLFDCYRINAIKLNVIPQANSNDTGAADALSIPVLHYCSDQDDSVSVSNESQILEKENVKTRRLDRPFGYYMRVNTAGEIYNNGITSAYSVNKRGVWIDSTYPNVAHFGFKGWVVTASTATLRLKIYATYYCQFKGVQ